MFFCLPVFSNTQCSHKYTHTHARARTHAYRHTHTHKHTRTHTHIHTYCLSICTKVFLSLCLSICVSVYLSLCLSISVSVCLSICLCVCLSVCLCVCLPVGLSAMLSVCLSLSVSKAHTHRLRIETPRHSYSESATNRTRDPLRGIGVDRGSDWKKKKTGGTHLPPPPALATLNKTPQTAAEELDRKTYRPREDAYKRIQTGTLGERGSGKHTADDKRV